MSVINSPPDMHAREDHLRHLLDQRAARADLHGRFPSLSEFSDSPSVYSRAHFSPHPHDRAQFGPNTPTFEFVIPAQVRPPASEPRSPLSDRERLNFPNASSLDLDEDPRSSLSFSNSHEDDDLSLPEEEEELPSVGQYGPKMTVHSRAPWELGEDEEREAEEQETSSSKRTTKKKQEGGRRVWGLGKGSNERRPSVDSNRSQSKAKQSIESFTSNGGALLALAQASMSSTSLAMTSSPQPTLRDKLSISRLRSRTPSNPNPIGSSNLEPIDTRVPPFPSQMSNTSPMSRLMRTASPTPLSPLEPTFSDSSRSVTPSTPHHEYMHPYANPDLVRRVYDHPPPLSPRQASSAASSTTSNAVNNSDSNATLTDTTTTSSIFQSRSNTTVSSMTPVTSLSSVNPSLGESSPPTRVHSKGVSTPFPVRKGSASTVPMNAFGGAVIAAPANHEKASPKMRSRDMKMMPSAPASAFPGWNDAHAGPSIKLISLEEAQAQARERSRSATVNPAISSIYTSGSSRSQTGSAESEPQGQGANSRVRSTSAGATKSKADPNQRPPIPGDSSHPTNVPPRLVTRKKSGFMRLFNGKERDKTLYSPPPPVPSLSSDSASAPSYPSSQAPRMRKGSAHRVPVPSLSPSLLGVDLGTPSTESGSSSDSRSDCSQSGSKESGSNGEVPDRERQLSARRNAPGLSIVTSPSMVHSFKAHTAPPFSAASESTLSQGSHGHTVLDTPTACDSFPSMALSMSSPNSAPPGSTDFVALSLRPVSTLFSNTFADRLVSPGGISRPSLDTDHGTPTTATTSVSPLSSDFPLKSCPGESDDKIASAITQEDQPAVIQALEEQILVARRAWQRQIWELEGQVRDLKAEVDELRAAESASPYCSTCGRGNIGRPGGDSNDCIEDLKKAGVKVGVVNRPRARTGISSRFASGT
ncbi:uncharacterized protein LAESUDRAFT_204736 [Laetiporus sulphureus 93-53]|uniref:Uncharacterized protein n=1 Tax=Laetiporus sulphureus 93-53 TaxID=1314785 RepID=A0A165DYL5_9APHY|nr:uncharacterized protein LAESUDRAFT_204736 [Laetiporus sulphureus 93-53]KZT05891.1 hypothetical protein LAESUDRAFT_204736 [Laetiporus sulphureus 93-53]